MGQVDVADAIAEAELEDAHAGHAEVLAQLIDLRRDEAEVLGDEGQRAEDVAEALEELVAGGLDPLAVNGGGPLRRESTSRPRSRGSGRGE